MLELAGRGAEEKTVILLDALLCVRDDGQSLVFVETNEPRCCPWSLSLEFVCRDSLLFLPAPWLFRLFLVVNDFHFRRAEQLRRTRRDFENGRNGDPVNREQLQHS